MNSFERSIDIDYRRHTQIRGGPDPGPTPQVKFDGRPGPDSCRLSRCVSPLGRRSLFRKACWSIIASPAALSLTGCSLAPKPPLRIGIDLWPGYEIMTLAHSLGFFRAEGLEVELVEYDSLSDARRALESGKVDAIGVTTIDLVFIITNNDSKSARVWWVFDYSNGADMIIAPKGIRSVAELKGKPVGVEVGSLGVYLLGRALEISGLQFEDVKPVPTHQLAMKEKLESGRIAAAVSYPPTSVELLKGGKNHILFDSRQIPGEVIDILAVDTETVRTRAADLAAFDRALNRAWIYLKTNREDAIKRMAQRERMSEKEFEQFLSDGIELIPPEDQAAFLKKGGPVDLAISRSAKYLQALSIIPTNAPVIDLP